MVSSMPWGFILLGLPILAGTVALVLLMAFPKTRVVGLSLACICGLALMLLFAYNAFFYNHIEQRSGAFREVVYEGKRIQIPVDSQQTLPQGEEIVVPVSTHSTNVQAVPEPATIGILLILLLIGGLAGVIALIVNARTRVLGIVLSALGFAALLVILVIGWYRATLIVRYPEKEDFRPYSASKRIDKKISIPKIPVDDPTPKADKAVEKSAGVETPKNAEAVTEEAAKSGSSTDTTEDASKKTEEEKQENPIAAADSPHPNPLPKGEGTEKAKGEGAEKSQPRPAWVDAKPHVIGEAYQMSITVGPWSSRELCEMNLPAALQEAVDQYVETCLGQEVSARVVLPTDTLQQLVKEKWEEPRDSISVGPMVNLHVLLQFDRKMKEQILEAHKRGVIDRRLWYTGMGVCAAFSMLAVCYGYLKMPGRKSA